MDTSQQDDEKNEWIYFLIVIISSTAAKKSSPEEGETSTQKSDVPVEKDVIDESNQQEPTRPEEHQEEPLETDELTPEDKKLMEVIQNMKISVADLEKHSQLLNKEMLMKLQHKLLKMKRGGDSKDINEYYDELKSKLITLKDNEVLCAATGKACSNSKLPKNTGESTGDGTQQLNDDLSHKNDEQTTTEKMQETAGELKSKAESIPERTGSATTKD